MKAFAKLYQRIDETTKTNDKVSAIREYFAGASNADAAYALYFLLGNKLKPSLPTRIIRQAAASSAEGLVFRVLTIEKGSDKNPGL